MTFISPLATTIVTAIVGWLAYQFLAKPLNRFFEIRSSVFSILEKYDDPPPGEAGGAAKQAFLGAAMDLRGFVGSESLISRLLGFAGIEPQSAASSLENLSEYWGWENTDYSAYRSHIRGSLNFHVPRRSAKGSW
jgi:hypothetical protein